MNVSQGAAKLWELSFEGKKISCSLWVKVGGLSDYEIG